MDLTVMRQKATRMIKQYRYVLLILAAGIILMLLPGKETKSADEIPAEEPEQQQTQQITSDQLAQILMQIKGVGKAEVLLTCASGETTVYQSNLQNSTSDSSTSSQSDTVILTDGSRGEHGMVTQVLAPEYLGAVVVCQGADDPTVKLAVADAVGKATGLGANCISVLRMK